jgi:hypothetical protein
MSYNPIPPRVWSRVQSQCTYIVPDSSYNLAYLPVTGQTVSQAQADYEMQLFRKGNILQYKGNSSRLTKKQKYTQLAKCLGPNRTKVFATQSQTYTNPNTTGLLRVNYDSYPYPNQIVGAPNNISGPFQYNVPNPFDCSSNTIQDGGTLVCGTYANPCTGEIIQTGSTSATICNPASASNVPGSAILCWNNNIQTWFPRQRYIMNNSGSKWPVNYKGLVSAVSPEAPVLLTASGGCGVVELSWAYTFNLCIPISSFNIYANGAFVATVPYTTTTFTVDNLNSDTTYFFYITSVSNTTESLPSNIINVNLQPLYTAIGYSTIFSEPSPGYTGIVFDSSINIQTITFNCSINNINVLVVAGGGGAGQTDGENLPGGGGGGGGGIYNSNNFSSQIGQYNIVVGNGGVGTNPPSFNPQYKSGGNSSISFGSTPLITVTGGGPSSQSSSSPGGTSGGPGGGSGYYLGGAGANGIYDTTWTQGKVYANGEDSGLSSITIPTSPSTLLYLSGGGGGAVNFINSTPTPEPNGPGGAAGKGIGGTTGGNTNENGASGINSFTNGGGFGGGGGGTPGFGNPNANSGNGGSGVVIFWWQTF